MTHRCSEEKIKSGIRIIEISIQSEEDIYDIIRSNTLRESENILFYNFKRNEKLSTDFRSPIQKYILHPSGKWYVDRHAYHCKNYHERQGVYEVSIAYDDCMPNLSSRFCFYEQCVAKAYKDHFLKKDCNICRWRKRDMRGDSFCVLYKKCGNPKFCIMNDAKKCGMFQEDQSFISQANEELDAYMSTHGCDIWRDDRFVGRVE